MTQTTMMDLTVIMPWIGAALAIIALFTQLKGFLSADEKKLEERLSKTEIKLIEHDRRVQKVEGELSHLPNKDHVMELKLSISELKGTVATLTETVGSVSRTAHRIDDFLRTKGDA